MVIGQCWRGLEMTTTQKTPNNSMIDSNHTLYRTHPYFNLTPNPPPFIFLAQPYYTGIPILDCAGNSSSF